MVLINITNRERIYINPKNGQRISGIQKGLISASDMEKSRDDSGTEGQNGETNEN